MLNDTNKTYVVYSKVSRRGKVDMLTLFFAPSVAEALEKLQRSYDRMKERMSMTGEPPIFGSVWVAPVDLNDATLISDLLDQPSD